MPLLGETIVLLETIVRAEFLTASSPPFCFQSQPSPAPPGWRPDTRGTDRESGLDWSLSAPPLLPHILPLCISLEHTSRITEHTPRTTENIQLEKTRGFIRCCHTEIIRRTEHNTNYHNYFTLPKYFLLLVRLKEEDIDLARNNVMI